MKLPKPNPPLDLTGQLAEFDIWITASLGEIRDTERFARELEGVISVFDALAATTNGFSRVNDCSAEAITEALLRLITGKETNSATRILNSAASLLFLTTGKSDNNAKCQFPLHLRDTAKWSAFPELKTTGSGRSILRGTIPRTLSSDRYMPLVASLQGRAEDQKRLLLEFVRFLLSDEGYIAQLWSIGHSYMRMKEFRRERDLLTPLVIFQVRGSVSASGGHEPEKLLRTMFDALGLVAGSDYNTADVVISGEEQQLSENAERKRRVKTRAFDFVLPYQTTGWAHRVYIQSQYYAGDSGSVSHKNVDQTSTSRAQVILSNRDAIFVEYVDGAGYFSSLNGDLKNLLSMANTQGFFQVRSAPIRMRRILQEIGFLTPMEVEHAVARTNGRRVRVAELLRNEGYKVGEIKRCIASALRGGLIEEKGDVLSLRADRRSIVRRFFLLDTIACHGGSLEGRAEAGHLLVPGYGPFYGMKLVSLLEKATALAPGFAAELRGSQVLLGDIQWLEERKYVISS